MFFYTEADSINSTSDEAEAVDQAVVAQMQKCEGYWQCTACGWQTKFKTRLYEHVEAKHVETNGYTCPICQKFCPTQKALKIHRSKYHRHVANFPF